MAGNGAESGAAGNGAAGNGAALYKPLGLLAELTHRCPLGCPYCSNPLALDRRGDELDTELGAGVRRGRGARRPAGASVRRRAGGAPRPRRHHGGGARRRPLHQSHHVGGRHHRGALRKLADAGLDHVQISIQDASAPPPTISPATKAPSPASARSRPRWCAEDSAHRQRGDASRQHRPHRRHG